MSATARRSALFLLAFDVLMDLARALHQQEQTAGDEDEVAPGEVVAGDTEDRPRQVNDPGDAAKHDDAEDQRERQADAPRHQPLLGRQPRYQQGDEHHVVDAEHDLHRTQGDEACPDMRVGQPVDEHHAFGARYQGGM